MRLDLCGFALEDQEAPFLQKCGARGPPGDGRGLLRTASDIKCRCQREVGDRYPIPLLHSGNAQSVLSCSCPYMSLFFFLSHLSASVLLFLCLCLPP